MLPVRELPEFESDHMLISCPGAGASCMMCDSCVEEVGEEGEGEVGDGMSQDEDEHITLDDMLVCEDGN